MDYLNIPVALCTYMLKWHIVMQIRLYTYLKTICYGRFKLSEDFINNCCVALEYKSKKTFKAHFEYLLQNKWLTFNSKSGSYRIVGLSHIANRLRFQTSKGAIFYPEYFKKFKGFVTGTVITYYMIKRSQEERRSALKKGSASKSRPLASYSLPHSYLAKVLNVPVSTARSYRKNAIDSGFLKAKKTYIETLIPISEIDLFKKFASVESDKIKIVNKSVCIQQADQIESSIFLRMKRDIHIITKKYRKKNTPYIRGSIRGNK
ncbi:MAG TPA: hypothetical protein VIH57_21105 [Bacteroidales bacterium]